MHSMTNSEEELLAKLLASHHLPLSAEKTHPAFFSGLTASEKAEVFLTKQGLYRPLHRLAKDVSSPENPPSHVVDLAAFLISIDFAKRPSFHKNRQLEGGIFPDFTEAYIRDKMRTRSSKNYSFVKAHFYEKIKKWRAEKIGWRRISEAIAKSPAGLDINWTTLMRIFKKIEKESNGNE